MDGLNIPAGSPVLVLNILMVRIQKLNFYSSQVGKKFNKIAKRHIKTIKKLQWRTTF